MRTIDRLLGDPLCFLLGLHSYIKDIFPNRTNEKVERILVIKLFGMGSIVLLNPMVLALRDRYPKAQLTLLTFQQNMELCRLLGIFDEIIGINSKTLFSFAISTFEVLSLFYRKSYDIALILEPVRYSSILSYLSKASRRVGFYCRDRFWQSRLLTDHVHYNPYKHITTIYLALAKAVDAKKDGLILPRIQISSPDLPIPSHRPLICINPNASHLSLERRWGKRNFSALIKRILDNFDCFVVLIGSGEDEGYTEGLRKLLPPSEKVINMVGKLTIEQLLVLLNESSLLITNDSGPLHFATMLHCPTISFFGPETPIIYGPLGDGHTVFYKDLYCSPCINVFTAKASNCDRHKQCMKEISVDEVYQAVVRILKLSSQNPAFSSQ